MGSIANPVTAATHTSTGSGTQNNTKTLDPLANESAFLTLLVSQLKNQDPLNPTDSTQFVSQLTSYSQLEQLISINHNTSSQTGTTPASSSTTNSDVEV